MNDTTKHEKKALLLIVIFRIFYKYYLSLFIILNLSDFSIWYFCDNNIVSKIGIFCFCW